MTDSTALTRPQSNALTVFGKVDNPIAFSQEMADAYASFSGCGKAQGQALALAGLCEGLDPMQFARTYHIVQGRPTMRADAMLANFRMNFGGNHEIVERSPARAAIKLLLGQRSYEAEYTWEQAQQDRWPWKNPSDHDKGLKDNWSTPTDRKNMLWARLVSDSLRAFCPELVAGVYTPEEIGDVVDTTSTKSEPITAEEFFASQQAQQQPGSQAEQPAAEQAVDAEFTPAEPPDTPDENQRLIDAIRDTIEKLAGDNAPQVMEQILQKREVHSFRSLTREQLVEIRDRLEAKLAAAKNQ